jgi:hypothetical protein
MNEIRLELVQVRIQQRYFALIVLKNLQSPLQIFA